MVGKCFVSGPFCVFHQTKNDKKLFNLCEGKILSSSLHNSVWRIKRNEELSNLYGEIDLFEEVKILQKTPMARHLVSMDNRRNYKEII